MSNFGVIYCEGLSLETVGSNTCVNPAAHSMTVQALLAKPRRTRKLQLST